MEDLIIKDAGAVGELTINQHPTWDCPKHGETDSTISIIRNFKTTTYCLVCIADALETLGVKPLPERK